MKRDLFKKIVLLSLLPLCACTEEDVVQLGMVQEQEQNGIVMTAKDFEYDLESRTQVIDHGDLLPIEFKWATGDEIGVFPEEGTQSIFPIKEESKSNDGKSAIFSGGGWALRPATRYAAYYPFIKSLDFEKNAIPVKFTGQTQTANASTEHLGQYDYMAAVATTPENENVNFKFAHLGCIVKLTVDLQEPTTLKSMSIMTNEDVLVTEGIIDLTQPSLGITPKTKTNELTMNLKDVTTEGNDYQVTIYFMSAPMNLTGKTLRVKLTDTADKEFIYYIKVAKEMEAGKAYRWTNERDITTTQLTTGKAFNDAMKRLCGDDLTQIRRVFFKTSLESLPAEGISVAAEEQENAIVMTKQAGKLGDEIIVSTTANKIFFNTDCSFMFQGCREMEIADMRMVEDDPGQDVTGYEAVYDGCQELDRVFIPKSLMAIGAKAFNDCNDLNRISIPTSVRTIGESAFADCRRLKEITIPERVTEFPQNMLYGCDSLTTIHMPSRLETIGGGAFFGCMGLKEITLPDLVNSLGDEVFNDCRGLVSVTLPEGIDNIPLVGFGHCVHLTTINIPESVKTIHSSAFIQCRSMTKITIPSKVTDIEDGAFSYCYKLNEVHCQAVTPPTLGKGAFEAADKALKIYVPAESVEAYKTSWSAYADKIQAEPAPANP